ncbi:A-kinase anchor protein AKAP7 [Hydrogenispora ethanolica]|uniref:A-kinase anchor protein AKAP7 n=1 Tax=Hydrogenispora ethanolica TaxID=1082276 RepID=A0A4R1S4Q6_HYDET|nr:2'-5' RNA ligase family protein [Hydrogenispora ethanolica]TCL74265.1 A-kinase anchor protein AKAP7 [Hydrogenispora ethanolica]
MDKNDRLTGDLETLYTTINLEGMEAIRSGQEKIDPHLNNLGQDKRLGLTLLITIKGEITQGFQFLTEEIQKIESEQYFYPETDLHITILDLISATESFEKNDAMIRESIKVVQNAMKGLSPFDVQFNGIIASNAAILVKGYDDGGLQKLRRRTRKTASEYGIILKERYQSISAHSTIVRFKKALKNREQLSAVLQQYHDFDMGVMKVNELELVVHDWYNRKKDSVRKLLWLNLAASAGICGEKN